jgi:hypothetical protein
MDNVDTILLFILLTGISATGASIMTIKLCFIQLVGINLIVGARLILCVSLEALQETVLVWLIMYFDLERVICRI